MTTEETVRPIEPYRILLVEDALDQAHLMQFLLENEAHARVTVIQDGLKGCRFARDRDWDLVISDINLPGADGLQVMQASRQSHPDTPILATTAYTRSEFASQALDNGADDFLQKPIDRDDLLEKVFTLLRRSDASFRGSAMPRPAPVGEREAAEAAVEPETPAADTAPALEPASEPGGETARDAAATGAAATDSDTAAEHHPHREARPGHVLAIGARPGDVEGGCGGALLAHRARGDSIAILTLIGRDGAPEERKAEMKRAGRRVGATLITGNIMPGSDRIEAEMAKLVESVTREFRPEVVYTHTPHDTDPEHRAAHAAALAGAPGAPHIYGFQTESSTVDFHPSVFIDISELLEGKLNLLVEYHFEEDEIQQVDAALVNVMARYWGKFSPHARAEPLEVIRSPRAEGEDEKGSSRHPLDPEPEEA